MHNATEQFYATLLPIVTADVFNKYVPHVHVHVRVVPTAAAHLHMKKKTRLAPALTLLAGRQGHVDVPAGERVEQRLAADGVALGVQQPKGKH